MHLFLNNSNTDSVFSLYPAKKSPKANLNGSIMALLVAKKGTQIVHVFRRKGIKFHKEVLYKKYVKAAHPVVKMVSASREKDGFNGYIGLCEGHSRFSEVAPPEDSTQLPYKYSWNPKLSKYLHQTIKPDWTTEDLYRELLSCPEIIALNSLGTETQIDQPAEDCALTPCEPPVQCAGPSFDLESTTEDEDMVQLFRYQHGSQRMKPGKKRKEMDQPEFGVTKKTTPSEKRPKHPPTVVSPTQDLLAMNSSKDRVARVSVRVTRKDDGKSCRVPTTPARPTARKTPRTPPGEMSAKGCNHEKWVDFQEWNSTYYVPKYMEGRVSMYYPKKCKGCEKTFVSNVSKSKTNTTFNPEKEFKVTGNQLVHVCPNATKDNHCCSFAVCQDCHSQMIKRYVIPL
jgi:hypothetical protein